MWGSILFVVAQILGRVVLRISCRVVHGAQRFIRDKIIGFVLRNNDLAMAKIMVRSVAQQGQDSVNDLKREFCVTSCRRKNGSRSFQV